MTTIVARDFDGMPAWEFSTPSGAVALVAERGATLLSWQPSPGTEVIAGYESAEELRNVAGERSLVMAPWCGRIDGGTYGFFDNRYELTDERDLTVFGGRVGECDFHRVPAESALVLVGVLRKDAGFPWELEVTVTFGLDTGLDGEEHLSVTVGVENLSAETAPVGVGWHPFLKMPQLSGISAISLTVPARTKVMADKRTIPLAGEAAFAGVSAPARYDYLGQQALDLAFVDLIPNEDGVVVTELKDPVHGSRLLVTQEPSEAPVVLVYTGEELARGVRDSLVIAPCSTLSNAVNRADSKSRLPLTPGAIRTLTVTLTYLP